MHIKMFQTWADNQQQDNREFTTAYSTKKYRSRYIKYVDYAYDITCIDIQNEVL